MKRIHWYLAGGVLAAVAVVAVVALLWHRANRPLDDDEPPPGYVPAFMRITLPPDDGAPYDQGTTVRAPDQPGWKTRVGNEAYGLPMPDFLAQARRTERLGAPQGAGDVRTLPPFTLAAVQWEDEDIDGWRLFELAGTIARILRSHKIVAFGSPVMVTFPRDGLANEGWKDTRATNWLGIPVPPDARIPEPLTPITFAGAEVLIDALPFERIDPTTDWDGLIAAALQTGREPMLPLVRRWSGWNLHEPAIQVQRMVPLKPAPASP